MDRSEIKTLVDQLVLKEQVSLLSGEDFWSLPAISFWLSASCASPMAPAPMAHAAAAAALPA